jgi:hypothetical protein
MKMFGCLFDFQPSDRHFNSLILRDDRTLPGVDHRIDRFGRNALTESFFHNRLGEFSFSMTSLAVFYWRSTRSD